MRARLLPLFALLILLPIVLFTLWLDKSHDDALKHESKMMMDATRMLYQSILKTDEQSMILTLKFLTDTPDFIQPFLAAECDQSARQRLLQVAKPFFAQMRQRNITHFYFHGVDQHVILRVHQPERYGDVIRRVSMQKAAKTGRVATAIELGPLGTLTLRVVMPWYQHHKLIGYIEVGEEIGDILMQVHQIDHVNVITLLHKHDVTRQGWEQGMKMLGRTANWDQLSDYVVGDSSMKTLPKSLRDQINHGTLPYTAPKSVIIEGKAHYRIALMPPSTLQTKNIAEEILLYDSSAMDAAQRNTMYRMIALLLLSGMLMLLLIWWGLGRHERELRHHELLLEKNEKNLRRILDHLPDTYYQVDMDGLIQYVSPAVFNLCGYTPEDMIGTQIRDYYAFPAKREDFLKLLSESHDGIVAYEAEGVHKNGMCFWGASTSQLLYGEDGAVVGIEGTIRDITESQEKHELVRKLSSTIEQSGESVLITDRQGIIEYVNSAFTTISGYSAEEAIGKTPALLNSNNQDAAFYTAMWNTITEGNVWHGKVIDKKKDGSFFPAMLTISPIVNDSGEITHFVGTHADLSKLEDMEQRFYQAQKMEVIGTMVGGIAHNFNNMLAGMTGNLYLAKQQVQGQSNVMQKLTNIEELSRHAAEMIQQLLTFARQGIVNIKELPLSPLINETLNLLHTSVAENIAVHQDLCADDLMIKGDATQLHQVLANLINNAKDAIEGVDQPCITIKLESFQTDDAFIENHPYFQVGIYAHLSVTDNGIGIAERHLKHLFDPFFTTKEVGKGTGLGLAMIYGAVKTHHGFIEVDSDLGKGSTFHIYIPQLEEKEVSGDTEHALKATEGQGELVLLVDDDQVMREVMAEVLEAMRYRVIIAADGMEAFDLFKTHEQEISIALFDLIMPNIGGVELAEQIRAMKPELPVIFMTGYDQGIVLAGGTQIQNSKIFAKPLDFNVLSHHIREMLD